MDSIRVPQVTARFPWHDSLGIYEGLHCRRPLRPSCQFDNELHTGHVCGTLRNGRRCQHHRADAPVVALCVKGANGGKSRAWPDTRVNVVGACSDDHEVHVVLREKQPKPLTNLTCSVFQRRTAYVPSEVAGCETVQAVNPHLQGGDAASPQLFGEVLTIGFITRSLATKTCRDAVTVAQNAIPRISPHAFNGRHVRDPVQGEECSSGCVWLSIISYGRQTRKSRRWWGGGTCCVDRRRRAAPGGRRSTC
mmetsp:Transcript_44225/g.117179  ORF Transcript_44225/g.117179 Transcript_44225/m.117179 type:complete len:250 (-) Transcript_44225:295-1044(-)